jgi:hypothetical protein
MSAKILPREVLLSEREAAELLGESVRVVQGLVVLGVLTAARISPRSRIYVLRSEVETLVRLEQASAEAKNNPPKKADTRATTRATAEALADRGGEHSEG